MKISVHSSVYALKRHVDFKRKRAQSKRNLRERGLRVRGI
jgi:hypothetical protein